MKKLKNKNGFTMVELLLVVAIIVILSAVAFIAVHRHQRALGQLERDGIAKEIFVAAQNHLTLAYGAGYAGITKFGTKESGSNEIYYFTISENFSEDSIEGHMLPYGSINETVRLGGSYIIRYQKDTGLVLDVFYCTKNGSPSEYNHELSLGDYSELFDHRDITDSSETANYKSWRRNWNGAIVGWYGGMAAEVLPTIDLVVPEIEIHNEEMLYVKITDTNHGAAQLKLIITGVESGAKKAFEVIPPDNLRVKMTSVIDYTYTVTLDDVTNSLRHFCLITPDQGAFIPGEDIEVQAVAYSNSALSNIAYSSKGVTNSLFAGINGSALDLDNDGTPEMAKNTIAYVGNIRHLENLDRAISALDRGDTGNKLNIQLAQQTTNMDWVDFIGKIYSYGGLSSDPYITDYSGNHTAEGYYKPISPDYSLIYDGKNHRISQIKVTGENDAGLFGSISTVSAIKNLELLDFDITGNVSAGALAGKTSSCVVTNVLAWNSTNSSAVNITAPDAGGLTGDMTGGSLNYSAAAVIVSGTTNTGGLAGKSSGSILSCYSGGHTKDANYKDWITAEGKYDVTGGTAGGLVGSFTGSGISDSYSTCSVSGTTVGGFAGSAAGTISNCYSTGKVDSGYAFLGSGSATLTGNYYFSIINEELMPDDSMATILPMAGYDADTQMPAIKPLDLDLTTYNSFVGATDDWKYAIAYDPMLVRYFRKSEDDIGKYSLKTVEQLNSALPSGYSDWSELFVSMHYGDWPAPELLTINE